MPATSNFAPRSFSRSAMNSAGTLSASEPNTRLTVLVKNIRSVHIALPQTRPA